MKIEGGSEEVQIKCYLPERGRGCQKKNSHWGIRGHGKRGKGHFGSIEMTSVNAEIMA